MFCPTEACGVQAADVRSAQWRAGLIGGVSLSGRDAAVSHLADKVRVGLLTPARRAPPRPMTRIAWRRRRMATHSCRVKVRPVTTGTGWFRALVQWLAAGCGFMGMALAGMHGPRQWPTRQAERRRSTGVTTGSESQSSRTRAKTLPADMVGNLGHQSGVVTCAGTGDSYPATP